MIHIFQMIHMINFLKTNVPEFYLKKSYLYSSPLSSLALSQ